MSWVGRMNWNLQVGCLKSAIEDMSFIESLVSLDAKRVFGERDGRLCARGQFLLEAVRQVQLLRAAFEVELTDSRDGVAV